MQAPYSLFVINIKPGNIDFAAGNIQQTCHTKQIAYNYVLIKVNIQSEATEGFSDHHLIVAKVKMGRRCEERSGKLTVWVSELNKEGCRRRL